MTWATAYTHERTALLSARHPCGVVVDDDGERGPQPHPHALSHELHLSLGDIGHVIILSFGGSVRQLFLAEDWEV